jgi:hypothetical protein
LPKRTLIAYDLGDTGKDFALAPEIRWRALRNLAGPEASLELTVSQRSSEQASASKTFSKAFGGFVDAARKGCADRMQEGTISHAGEEAFKRTLLPLSGIISLLSAYASAKLEVFSTTRGASFAFNLLPSPAPDGLKRLMEKSDFTPDGDSRYFRDFLLRSDESSVVPASICPELHATIKMENEVLGAIIPGLSLELKELNEETLDDGKPGKRVELLSRRGGYPCSLPLRI